MAQPFHTLCFVRDSEHPSPLEVLCAPMACELQRYGTLSDVPMSLLNDSGVLLLVSLHNQRLGLRGLPSWLEKKLPAHNVALIDVVGEELDPVYALKLGYRGLLKQDDRPDIQLMALRGLVKGELWYPRSTLEKVVQNLLFDHQQRHQSEQEKLTKRERELVRLVAEGARNKEIAQKLFISEYTVKAHLASIFRKTETRSRAELIGKLGLVE
ncbi:helix-turn-helix transcriptional regulator [Ferrimonas marina]|uniref:Regulatory protein, luxR family n=1 Tax=Ferrimonas marina TaxID=299255 RepID=A0A1M5VM67_9GAMM|nr:response regulator transcription factor [Ferrimonas marina]SHH76356.1 regulatory protein, luxR family [Ferrimonas marina]